MYFLTHGNVGLRALHQDDLNGGYLSWFDDPEVCRYNSHHVYPITREELEKFIRTQRDDPSRFVLAVERLDEKRHIGNLSLQRINFVDRNAEFAILMGDKESWGQGLAKQAGALLCWHGFKALNLHRIYCGTHAENIGMVRLAAYLQMQSEGSYREALFKNGVYVDALRFGVLQQDFLMAFNPLFGETPQPGY